MTYLQRVMMLLIAALVFAAIIAATGCASTDVKQHTLICIILCIESDTEMKRGDTQKDAAPTSLDGMVLTPAQRKRD